MKKALGQAEQSHCIDNNILIIVYCEVQVWVKLFPLFYIKTLFRVLDTKMTGLRCCFEAHIVVFKKENNYDFFTLRQYI